MLKTRLIPSLLLLDGRCVKGVRFKGFRDVGHPVTAAKVYDAQGADELLFLDIRASQEGRATLLDIVQQTAEQCFMPLTVGGGVRTVDDIRTLLRSGADKVTINTAAVENPELLSRGADKFGVQCIVVSIDYVGRDDGFREVVVGSGTRKTGKSVVDWAVEVEKHGAGEILLTAIDQEGSRAGYDLETVQSVADVVRIPVIASGGVGTLQDLVDGVVDGHASAVAAASIFHFTDQSVIKATSYMQQQGLDVRMA